MSDKMGEDRSRSEERPQSEDRFRPKKSLRSEDRFRPKERIQIDDMETRKDEMVSREDDMTTRKKEVTIQQACELVRRYAPSEERTERIPVEEACGRVLAEDVYADFNHPPFDRSPLDGYAVRSEDIREASKERPARLFVVGSVFAGCAPELSVGPGQAVRIMTGAPIPEGADCVVKQENTKKAGPALRNAEEIEKVGSVLQCAEEIEKAGPALRCAAEEEKTGGSFRQPAGKERMIRETLRQPEEKEKIDGSFRRPAEETTVGETFRQTAETGAHPARSYAQPGEFVQVLQPVKYHGNYCFAGEDFRSGQQMLKKGQKLTPAAVGLLAGLGRRQAIVYRLPRVAVVTTGDEFIMPGQPLTAGKIYNSNLFLLQAAARSCGAEVTFCRAAGDSPEEIAEYLKEAAGAADLVITTGGVSVGEKDYLPQALHMTGAEMIFNRISIKPGSPTTFSVLNGTPVLSLTGTPFGAAVNFHLLARPVLAAVGRDASIEASYEYARFRGVFGKESRKTRYIRGFLRGGEAFAADGSGRYPAAEKAADVKASDAVAGGSWTGRQEETPAEETGRPVKDAEQPEKAAGRLSEDSARPSGAKTNGLPETKTSGPSEMKTNGLLEAKTDRMSKAEKERISEVPTPGAPTERRMKEEYDCFIEIPAGSTGLSDGERVRVVSL